MTKGVFCTFKEVGWCGTGEPMLVGVGYTTREFCDGQTFASPGRWPVDRRRHPEKPGELYPPFSPDFARARGTQVQLAKLALGKDHGCPFDGDTTRSFKCTTKLALGFCSRRDPLDRTDVQIDSRYLVVLLRTTEDPDVSLGNFARGVSVGPGARLP